MSLQDFFSMSGYARYVWSCYGLTVLVLLWNLYSARAQLQQQIRKARQRLHSQQRAASATIQPAEAPP